MRFGLPTQKTHQSDHRTLPFKHHQFPKAKAMRGIKKGDLPTKNCTGCGRPFAWRKKWAKVWNEVKYCSDRCRTKRHTKTERQI